MADNSVKLVTREAGVPNERDPVALMAGVVPRVPIVVDGAPTTIPEAIGSRAPLDDPSFSGTVTAPAYEGDGSAVKVKPELTGAVARSQAARAADVVNIKDWGARGDDNDPDTDAIQAAFTAARAAGKVVIFPPGTYIITAPIETWDVGYLGSGERTLFKANFNGPVFRSTSNGFSVSGKIVGRFVCRFELPNGTDYTNTSCVEIAGDEINHYSDNWLRDITGQGAYTAVRAAKRAQNGPFGYEGRVGRNHFTRIQNMPWNALHGRYVVYFPNGSGTANVFEQMSGSAVGFDNLTGVTDPTAAIFRYDGTAPMGPNGATVPMVVGDITFSNSQFQAPNIIVRVGPGSVYNDNINFFAQYDGVGDPIAFEGAPGIDPGTGQPATPRGISILANNMGGGISIGRGLGQPVRESRLQDRGTSLWTAGLNKNPTSSPNYFIIRVDEAFATATCTVTLGGLLGGVGAVYARVTYALVRRGSTVEITAVPVSQAYINADGSVRTTPSGAQLRVGMNTPLPDAGSPSAYAFISAAFENQNGGNQIEGQIEVVGGSFLLTRVP